MIRIYLKFVSLIAVIATLLFTGPASKATTDRAPQQRRKHTSTEHVQRRAVKVRKRVRKQAATYVCPMHPDMRSKSHGECPKCGMEMVNERVRKDRAVVLAH
jgi:predicted RNA-binding Zn-ribbon protein involved in translation (DUF1610 family)